MAQTPSPPDLDFFSWQEDAEASSLRLVTLFRIATVAIGVATGIMATALTYYFDWTLPQYSFPGYAYLLTFLGGGTLGILCIWIGSLIDASRLKKSGPELAESMGATPLDNPQGLMEIRLVNIVEEMSIAAGIPVPTIHVLGEEQGINAAAIGHDNDDAALIVTRGAIDRLNREQLQAVLAHEIAHLVGGDCTLRLKLLSLFGGINHLGALGFNIIGVPFFLGDKAKFAKGMIIWITLPLITLGLFAAAFLSLLVYPGKWFTAWVERSISRQREHLADARAVQFTRNPAGLSGAFRTIGGFVLGSRLMGKETKEFHCFFIAPPEDLRVTNDPSHPPLEQRIERILPGWDGSWIKPHLAQATVTAHEQQPPANRGNRSVPIATAYDAGLVLVLWLMLNEVGEAAAKPHLSKAFKGQVPSQWEALRAGLVGQEIPLWKLVLRLAPHLKKIPAAELQPLYDLAKDLVRDDNTVSWREFIVMHTLRTATTATERSNTPATIEDLQTVLSFAASRSSGDNEAKKKAFKAAAQALKIPLKPQANVSGNHMGKALSRLNHAPGAQRRDIIKALTVLIKADGDISEAEQETLALYAIALGVPVRV